MCGRHEVLFSFSFLPYQSNFVPQSDAAVNNVSLIYLSQCIPSVHWCDGLIHCSNAADTCRYEDQFMHIKTTNPFLVELNGVGSFTPHPLADAEIGKPFTCPDSHFQCDALELCLPVYVRCNEVYDCPGLDDEMECGSESYTCPGFYRCRDSAVCLHVKYICDGIGQCPQLEDESLCDISCPSSCLCEGLAFTCSRAFDTSEYPRLKYLEARGSRLALTDVTFNTMLVHLGLAECGVLSIMKINLPNLHSLDLRDNYISRVLSDSLFHVPNLKRLLLGGNPVESFFQNDDRIEVSELDMSRMSMTSFHNGGCFQVLELDVSRTSMTFVHNNLSAMFPNVRILNLSHR